MKIKNIFFAFIVLMLIFSCKKEEIKKDNIYKFKEYISYTTSGVVSRATNIEVNLAKNIDAWQPYQEISSDFITIKPHVKGVLKTNNKHAFLLMPDEKLLADTEYTVTVHLHKIYKNIPQEFYNYTFQFKTIAPNFKVQTNTLQSYSKE